MPKNIKDQTEEELHEEPKSFFNSKPESKTQKGRVALITKTRIIVEYGAGLGAELPFDPEIHSDVKVGDEINIP